MKSVVIEQCQNGFVVSFRNGITNRKIYSDLSSALMDVKNHLEQTNKEGEKQVLLETGAAGFLERLNTLPLPTEDDVPNT